MKTWVLVCDRGHYGYDSGAVGPTGLYEATATRIMGDEFARLCATVDSFEIHETNSVGQTSLTGDLQVRCDQANAWYDANRNNLFISFHINCDDSPKPAYISTWIQAYGGAANQFATIVQGRLCAGLDFEKYGMEDGGIKTANFKVLRSTTAPAVLIECGFISNPGEESALRNPDECKLVARLVFEAVLKYTGVQPMMDPTTRIITSQGEKITPATIINGSFFSSVKVLAESLGASASFDQGKNQVVVRK